MIDFNRPLAEIQADCDAGRIKTREGLPVRIYAIDGAGFGIHGAIARTDGWAFRVWHRETASIYAASVSADDLMSYPATFRVERWVNVYEGDIGVPLKTKAECDRAYRSDSRTACVKVIIEGAEGDGV